jgi:hypothetical protein
MNERAKEYARGNSDFEAWLVELDKLVSDRIVLSLFDLEDVDLWSSFESGDTPEDCLQSVVIKSVRDNHGDDCAELLEL